MAKEAYWFKHDANANRDDKIRAMRSVYKMEGVGLYWSILELMREQETCRLPKTGKYWCAGIASEFGVSEEFLRAFLTDCVEEFRLFIEDDWSIWSESFIRRHDERSERSRKARESAQLRWERERGIKNGANMRTHAETDANASEAACETDANASENDAIRKREEREKKERRVRVEHANKILPPPSLEEAIEHFRQRGYRDPDTEGLKFWNHFDSYGWRGSRGKGARIENWHRQASTWEQNNRKFETANAIARKNNSSQYHERATRNLTEQDIRDAIALDLTDDSPG